MGMIFMWLVRFPIIGFFDCVTTKSRSKYGYFIWCNGI